MRELFCIKCKKEQPMSLDTSSRAAMTCVFCGTKQKARTNKNGRLSLEEMEVAEDIVIPSKLNPKPSGG
ncbi:MAG: hypothetical protein FWE22_06820 [Firmicutes bacterium]|jgi:hypothetical protein|nr:hypothetical protein [Bacillota bacterium]